MALEGLLLIDGTDAYTAYKAVVVMGGHNGLLKWPSLKAVETNDWHEYDGIEADLSSPVLDSKEFSVDFYVFGKGSIGLTNLYALVAALRNGSYHAFNFAQVGREAKLRAVSFGDPELYPNGIGVSITFADDFPLNEYEYLAPSSSEPGFYDYLIDETPFTDYGIRIIEGTLKSAINMADVKKNLLRNISIVPGAIYDDPAEDEEPDPNETLVKLSFRDLKLRCYLRAGDLTEFWQNYDALLYDLTQPGARVLTSRLTGRQLSCYYQSCEIEEFLLNPGKVSLIFTITLKVIGDAENAAVLAEEANKDYILAENGKMLEVEFSF